MTVREFREFERSVEWSRWQSTILGGDNWDVIECLGKRWNMVLWDHCFADSMRMVLQEYRDGLGEGLSDPNVRLQRAKKLAELEMLSAGYAPPHFKGVARCKSCGFVASAIEQHGHVIARCDWCDFPGVQNVRRERAEQAEATECADGSLDGGRGYLVQEAA